MTIYKESMAMQLVTTLTIVSMLFPSPSNAIATPSPYPTTAEFSAACDNLEERALEMSDFRVDGYLAPNLYCVAAWDTGYADAMEALMCDTKFDYRNCGNLFRIRGLGFDDLIDGGGLSSEDVDQILEHMIEHADFWKISDTTPQAWCDVVKPLIQTLRPVCSPTTPNPTPSPTTKEPTPSPTMKPTTTTQALIEQLSSDVGVLQDQLSSLPDKRRERTPCQQKQNLSWKYEIADRKCEIKKLKKAQKGKIATCLGRDARKERLLARLQTLESDQVADLSTCQV